MSSPRAESPTRSHTDIAQLVLKEHNRLMREVRANEAKYEAKPPNQRHIAIAQVVLDTTDEYDELLQKVRANEAKYVAKWKSKSKRPAELRQLINAFHREEKRLLQEKKKAIGKMIDTYQDMLADSNLQAEHAMSGMPRKAIKKAHVSRLRRQESQKVRSAASKGTKAVRKSVKASSPKSPKRSRSPTVASAD